MRVHPTPGCSFVARVAFDLEGLPFQPGDPFPFTELGWTEDAAWNFWRAAMIEVAQVPMPRPPAPAPAPAPAGKPAPPARPARR